eukprot:CAMPEP_0206548904 /NCGR_PEP_ID=MMETSP0325_2-20121206/14152_1 /ASSEMBLY_ACC=CAM_ASM_000347 /TAXON_ID=2866 /ORGANISM="Crypthecodinium cohnii, Strain Seligo" /LENGTH=333 /DNA_ID=CAMNT_0054048455 /DNA_START=26 /DNA_END=1027 /DNA_ORIENTATION=+
MMRVAQGVAAAAVGIGFVLTTTTAVNTVSDCTKNPANCASLHSHDVEVPVSPNTPDRRKLDPVTTVRPEHSAGKNPIGVDDVEWKARTEAAALYRLLYIHDMGSDLAAQCVMHRIPGREEFLMGEWGLFFEEQTASAMLKYDFDGNLVYLNGTKEVAEPGRSNMGCIPVAVEIMKFRPDVQTVLHIHPLSVMAVGGLKDGLQPLSQAAFFLYGQVSREAYDFTYENSFADSLRRGFSNGKRAMLLNHHGLYAVGRDAAEAFFVAKHVKQACDVQVMTLGMAGADESAQLAPPAPTLIEQYKDMMASRDYAYDGSREWPGLVRQLQRRAADYNM